MLSFFGLGKGRTKFGQWLDKHGISQKDIEKESGVNKNTISQLANDPDHSPNTRTIKRIMKALREFDPNIKSNDFWDM